eukprot:scaffold14789_cov128-Skeletonema_dohrnii-CCMP3373.AAC.1
MEVFEAGLNELLPEGATNEVYELQTDSETELVWFMSEVTVSVYCNGTNDCVSEAFESFNTFKTELSTSIDEGSFTDLIQEIATEEGVTELESAAATSVETTTPE